MSDLISRDKLNECIKYWYEHMGVDLHGVWNKQLAEIVKGMDEDDLALEFRFLRESIRAIPSADAVSMEEHIKELNDLAVEWIANYDETMAKVAKECEECKERLRNIRPSDEAVQGWRTGKPTENGEYMVTLEAWGYRYIDVMHYAKPLMPNREVDGKCWYRYDDDFGDVVYDDSDVVAWMPLPKPYKGGDDE